MVDVGGTTNPAARMAPMMNEDGAEKSAFGHDALDARTTDRHGGRGGVVADMASLPFGDARWLWYRGAVMT